MQVEDVDSEKKKVWVQHQRYCIDGYRLDKFTDHVGDRVVIDRRDLDIAHSIKRAEKNLPCI